MNKYSRSIVIISENFYEPIDEGMKKTSYNILLQAELIFENVFAFCPTNNEKLLNCVSYHSLGKSFLSFSFRRLIKILSPSVILYIPGSSGTIGGFLRSFALRKFIAPNTKIYLLCLQLRKYSFVDKIIISLIRPSTTITTNEENRKIFEELGLNVKKIFLGIDVDKFIPVDERTKKDLRVKYNLPLDKKIVLHIGHIKSNRQLIELCDNIDNKFQLLIVGSTSTEQDESLKAKLLDKGARIISDYIENIQEVYQLSDCYIFHVTNNAAAIDIPLSVLEAMAVNLPVITTKYGDLPIMLNEKINGLHFVENRNQIKEKLEFVFGEQSLTETRRAVLNYTWEKVLKLIFTEGVND
jgi:glycosyltransferase involved in cell wall biosynthesis